jgi:hypothetical protein
MTEKNNVYKKKVMDAFNQHLKDLMNDIHTLFPDNLKVRTLKNSLLLFLKMNPKKAIELWFYKINSKYSSQIMNEDFDFFLEKDYSDDLKDANATGINVSTDLIEELKEPIKNMDDENIKMAIKYIKDLTQLSAVYFA